MSAAACVTCTGRISIKLSWVGTVGIVFGFYLTHSRCVGAGSEEVRRNSVVSKVRNELIFGTEKAIGNQDVPAVALRVTELGHEITLLRIWSSAVAVAWPRVRRVRVTAIDDIGVASTSNAIPEAAIANTRVAVSIVVAALKAGGRVVTNSISPIATSAKAVASNG